MYFLSSEGTVKGTPGRSSHDKGLPVMCDAAMALVIVIIVFMVFAVPALAQTENVLYAFCFVNGCTDGFGPISSLTSDGQGDFYGATIQGGDANFGTVFEMSPNGSGFYNESVIYSFNAAESGIGPLTSLLRDRAGNLYGTAGGGTGTGKHCSPDTGGCGIVFELSASNGSWTYSVLYNFNPNNGVDGYNPAGQLVMDRAGNLYGTTVERASSIVQGTVYKLSPSQNGWTEQVIYNERGSGGNAGVVLDSAGNLYGVSTNGPGQYLGYVFELSPNGVGGWNARIIHAFSGSDGANPETTPVIDAAGNIAGTTQFGGAYGFGVVWGMSHIQNRWVEKTLHSFSGSPDGLGPVTAALVLDALGNIYGTTALGGLIQNPNCPDPGCGTVFELSPAGGGNYTEKVWQFTDVNGHSPVGGVTLYKGNLFGTTQFGGGRSHGIAFELSP